MKLFSKNIWNRASLLLSFLILLPTNFAATVNAAPLNNFQCIQEEGLRRLGSVSISCFLEHPWSEEGISTSLQISPDDKNWKLAPTSDKYVGAENGPCTRNYVQIFETNDVDSYCYYLDFSYEPSKTGQVYLRASAAISGKLLNSNSVAFDVDQTLFKEQNENRINDAKNKRFKLKVNWPERFQVGKSKSLKVTSVDKYSGSCMISSRNPGQIEFKTFNMKKGFGAVNMRGLKKGAVSGFISCTQSSGSGPYATADYVIYFY